MNLHEYQAKQLFASYGLPVPKNVTAKSIEEALVLVDNLTTKRWVVKAQVHAGGRGKAGGVKVVSKKEELAEIARKLLHSRLVTAQTDEKGQPVNEILIEEPADIERELYLGMVIDRSLARVVFIASTEGGVEIEKVAHDTPHLILKQPADPMLGILPYECRELAFKLKLNEAQSKQLTKIMTGLYKLFIDSDLSLVEINPLVVTKTNVDDNALYRQPNIRQMRDTAQEDEREILAREWELNYIPLEGDIGCMVNGAGLAMATMDIIKLYGGNPANFLDVGGGATKERVREAFKIILSDEQVKAVLVNIFGGIVRCDLIAEGIMTAVSEVGIKVPVVVRLEGNRAKEASELLSKSNLNIISATTLKDAAEKVVEAASGGKRLLAAGEKA